MQTNNFKSKEQVARDQVESLNSAVRGLQESGCLQGCQVVYRRPMFHAPHHFILVHLSEIQGGDDWAVYDETCLVAYKKYEEMNAFLDGCRVFPLSEHINSRTEK